MKATNVRPCGMKERSAKAQTVVGMLSMHGAGLHRDKRMFYLKQKEQRSFCGGGGQGPCRRALRDEVTDELGLNHERILNGK